MVPTTLGLAHVSPWIATRRSLTLRSSRIFLIGGATALVLMMSGMATPALRANLDTRHSPWTVVGSMVRSKRRNAQVSNCSTDSGWLTYHLGLLPGGLWWTRVRGQWRCFGGC